MRTQKVTLSRKDFERRAYYKGEPRGGGPRCATCGDLAAWGAHPLCERKRGNLYVWITEEEQREF